MKERRQKDFESSVISSEGQLAKRLSSALVERGLSADFIAERTKVPRSTVRALLGATEPAVIPQRIYYRGFASIVARELGVPVQEAVQLFDEQYPREERVEEERAPRFNRSAIAVAACLCSIGVIAVILAFVS